MIGNKLTKTRLSVVVSDHSTLVRSNRLVHVDAGHFLKAYN